MTELQLLRVLHEAALRYHNAEHAWANDCFNEKRRLAKVKAHAEFAAALAALRLNNG